MKLDPNNSETRPILGDVPGLVFESRWPSAAAQLDPKVQSLLSGMSSPAVLQSVANSNWNALQIVVYNKATIIGDLLSDQLQAVSSLKPVVGKGLELFGLFARVDWSHFRDNPAQAVDVMVNAGIKVGLNALTAVPMVGPLADVFFNFGDRLIQIIESIVNKRPLLPMPWSEYSRDPDEDLTRNVVLGNYSKQVDQTNLFRPPWVPKTPWVLGFAGDADGLGRMLWAPWTGVEIPWSSDNVGLIPGTMSIFGQVQMQRVLSGTVYPGLSTPAASPNLKRITAAGAEIPWPPHTINVGNYYPSAASTCGAMWNMSSKPGSPDMFKIHAQTLLDEWALAFESMEQSFADIWEPGQPNLVLGAAQVPWIAYRLRPEDPASPWLIGPPWNVPSFASWVVPGLYSGERPGAPKFITDSLWIEEALERSTERGVDGRRMHPGWPYGKQPKQHPCSREGSCSSTLGATATASSGVTHPASWKTASGPAPSGYRKVAWPTDEMRWAQYASPWNVIVKPAIERLKAQQEASLRATIVSAYVRPVDLPNLPKYGAFRDGESLQKLCLDMREQLLAHPIRYRVNLVDAEAIDPQFAAKLKASGLTGGPSDWGKALGRAGGPVDGAAAPPPGIEPQGGLPFGPFGRLASEPACGGGGDGAAGLIAALAGGGLVVGGGIALARLAACRKGRRR